MFYLSKVFFPLHAVLERLGVAVSGPNLLLTWLATPACSFGYVRMLTL